MTVAGAGALADRLRQVDVLTGVEIAVLVPPIAGVPGPFVEVDDDTFDTWWERPMRWTIDALRESFGSGAARIVVVVPALALTGGRDHPVAAAAAEAIRATAKSAARQWGARGVTVNTMVVGGEWFGLDADAAGPASIAPPALADRADVVAAIASFAGGAAAHVTGQTVVVDGGVVMP